MKNKKKLIRFIQLFFILSLLFPLTIFAWPGWGGGGNTLVVDATPTCSFIGCWSCEAGTVPDNPYKTIKDALNHAKDGDTIKICPGNYNEGDLKIKNNITIESTTDNPNDVIIFNNKKKNIFETSGWRNGVNIRGLTITQNNKKNAIELKEGTNFNFSNLIIHSKKFGILLDKILNSTFDNITIYAEDIAFLINQSHNGLNILNCYFKSNKNDAININKITGDFYVYNTELYAPKADGIWIKECNYVKIENSYIHNTKWEGVYIKKNKEKIDFIGNKLEDIGNYGLYIKDSSNPGIIKNNIFKSAKDYNLYLLKSPKWRGYKVLNNCFFNTSLNRQIYSKDKNASFDDGSKGNYWEHFNCVDSNGDGICENSYTIPGSTGKKDHYPLKSCLILPSENLQPVVNYQMDECYWNGTAGEVIDNSSNGYNGKAYGATTSKDGKICRSGDFTKNGIGDYIKLPVEAMDGLDDFSLSVWVKTLQNKGQQEILQGLANNKHKQDNEFELYLYGDKKIYVNIKGNVGNGVDYSLSKNEVTDGNWHQIFLTRHDKTVCLYIDGNKKQCKTSNVFHSGHLNIKNNSLLIAQEQDCAGGCFNSSQDFEGYIDELKIFNKKLSDEEIENIYKNESSGKNYDGSSRTCNNCITPSNIDHFEITDNNNDHKAIACEPEIVCFTAKDKDNNTLTSYTGEVKMSSFLDHSLKGSWYKTFSGYTNPDPPQGNLMNEGHSTSGYIFQNSDKGTFCVFLSNKQLNGNPEKIKVLIKSASENVENSAYIDFYKAALKFSWENEGTNPWDYQISCKDSSTNPKTNNSRLYLTAINTNDATGACEKLFNGAINLKGRINYIEPAFGEIVGSPSLSVNNKNISFQKDPNPDKWDSVKLNFINGKAQLNLNYQDAGKLSLEFAYNYSGNYITTVNSNNEITFSPFGIFIDFKNIDAKDNNNINSFKTTLKSKSDTFSIYAKGVCYDPNDDKSPKDGVPDVNSNLSDNKMPLKNFHSDISLIWNVSNPSGGTGNLIPAIIKDISFKNGVGQVAATFSDVGILKISSATAANYIFANNNIIGLPLHKYIGRFIPHHFAVTNKSTGILRENCSTFNYAGDTLTYLVAPSFKIIAQNRDNETTKNYKGNFNFLSVKDISLNYPTEDDNQLGNSKKIEINITKATPTLLSNGDGTFKYTLGNDKIVYLKDNNSKISPFTPNFSITISKIEDKDKVSCDNLPQSLSVSGQSIKYGKLKILDNYGPETEDLQLRLEPYFWNNGDWELNDEDSSTTFNKSDFVLKNFTDKLKKGDTDIKSISNISNGTGFITLSAPGKDKYGSVDVDFTSHDFLHEDDSSGKATFGIYRGRDRVIMWEEVPAK
jgi:MSHA biogenesis protein MshQ